MLAIGMVVNRDEMLEVVKRIFTRKGEEKLNEAIKEIGSRFDKEEKIDDKAILVLEDNGFYVAPLWEEYGIKASLELHNMVRETELNVMPCKYITFEEFIETYPKNKEEAKELAKRNMKAIKALLENLLEV